MEDKMYGGWKSAVYFKPHKAQGVGIDSGYTTHTNK